VTEARALADTDYAIGFLLFAIEQAHPGFVRAVADKVTSGPGAAGLARLADLADGKP
jgi:hypothetical protein